jgi:hypothetical protein
MTNAQYGALRWAIEKAEAWKGSLTGHPDPKVLDKFEANIKLAKEGLKEAARMRGAERKMWAGRSK